MACQYSGFLMPDKNKNLPASGRSPIFNKTTPTFQTVRHRNRHSGSNPEEFLSHARDCLELSLFPLSPEPASFIRGKRQAPGITGPPAWLPERDGYRGAGRVRADVWLAVRYLLDGWDITRRLKFSKFGPTIWESTLVRSFEPKASLRNCTISGDAAPASSNSIEAQRSFNTGWRIPEKWRTA
jgi:hypothetical protein